MPAPLKIGVIAPPWLPVPPTGYGGTEAVVDQLCRGLRDAGHDVTLVAHAASTCPVRVVSVLAARHDLEINEVDAEHRHAAAAYELLRGHDIIHDHTRVGAVHARDVQVPVVVTTHGPFDAEARERLRSADAPNLSIVAISAEHARHATGLRIAAVIHHGIDLDGYPESSRARSHLVFLGRMSPDKGVHLAVRYAREAGVPLLVAAKMREPGERDYFRREVAPGLGGDVIFVGEVAGTMKTELLASARALLNPIRWPEPFGMVMIEAMACGTPVITSPLGAVPEIVAQGLGFVVDDDRGYLDAIARIDEIDRDAVRAHVRREFSRDRMVAAHVALYRSLIGDESTIATGARR